MKKEEGTYNALAISVEERRVGEETYNRSNGSLGSRLSRQPGRKIVRDLGSLAE